MADSKITALTALTSADPANDMFPVVDVSDTTMAASGTTKRISINNILACSPSATLASATITGDLTVDTSTLKVDSTNNRVIVGHTSGSSAFQVTNAGAAGLEIQPTGVNSAPVILSYNRSTSAYGQLTLDGSSVVHNISGTTAMTLNSTGLGVGGSASARIHAIDSGGACALFTRAAAPSAGLAAMYIQAPVSSGFSNTTLLTFWYQNTGISNPASETLSIRTNSAERIRYGSDGNAYHSLQGAVPSIPNDGEMVFNFTSNTNLRISARGSDGVTRVANITLA